MMRRFRYRSISSSSPGSGAAGQPGPATSCERAERRHLPSTLRSHGKLLIMLGTLLLAACGSNSARFSAMPGKSFPPKDETFEVAVFESVLPSQAFERIARIDVQMEMSTSAEASLQDAIPELKRQARRAGADAIIDIRLKRSKSGEITVFQVSAMGIRYSQN